MSSIHGAGNLVVIFRLLASLPKKSEMMDKKKIVCYMPLVDSKKVCIKKHD
jgi:hypothetical protein